MGQRVWSMCKGAGIRPFRSFDGNFKLLIFFSPQHLAVSLRLCSSVGLLRGSCCPGESVSINISSDNTMHSCHKCSYARCKTSSCCLYKRLRDLLERLPKWVRLWVVSPQTNTRPSTHMRPVYLPWVFLMLSLSWRRQENGFAKINAIFVGPLSTIKCSLQSKWTNELGYETQD